MVEKIKTHSLGKLEIYIEPAHKIRQEQRTLFRRMFPKSAYLHIISEAKKDGIMKASAFSTHTSYSNDDDIQSFSVEGDNSKVAMCVTLVDKKEKLKTFFYKHKDILRSKIVIYKEVEFWDVD
jgi:PII-like signaling protein